MSCIHYMCHVRDLYIERSVHVLVMCREVYNVLVSCTGSV